MDPPPETKTTDDLPVLVELAGWGTSLRAVEVPPREVIRGKIEGDAGRDWKWEDEKLEQFDCRIRRVTVDPSDGSDSGDVLASFTIQAEEGLATYPEFKGTVAIISCGVELSQILEGYTFGQARQMRLMSTGLQIGDDFLTFGDFDIVDYSPDMRAEATYLAGRLYTREYEDEELDLLDAFIEDHEYVLKFAPNHSFCSVDEILTAEEDWRKPVMRLIASMPSERRKHLYFCPLKLKAQIERAMWMKLITEIAP